MRLTTLQLRRFGHFEDAELDFSGTECGGVHVVFGPNEAGKTTTLDAIRYTLFGMPQGRSNEPKYDFRFKTGQIRTAMRLVLDSGEQLAFARSRSTKASIHDFDTDAPDATLDARLARALAGVPRAVWDQKHGLDQDGLRAGAKALLENAATDESLFAAATGSASVHRVLDELRAARQKLLSDAGSAGELHAAVKELKDATAELGKAKRASATYDDTAAEHRALDARVEELNAARHRAEQARDELDRALAAAPKLAQRTALVTQLEAFADVPATWTDADHAQLVEALDSSNTIDAQLGTITASLEPLRMKLEELAVDDALLAAADTLDLLHQRLAVVAQAADSLPELRVETRRAVEAARAALDAVRPGADTDADPAASVPTAAVRTQLATELDARVRLEETVAQRAAELERAQAARDAAGADEPASHEQAVDVEALDAAIELAGRIDVAALEADRARHAAERAALEQRAARIPGAKLDVDGACCVGVPGERERAELEQAFEQLDQRRAAATERLTQAERHAADYRARLAELEQGTGTLDVARLPELRAARDNAFDPIRRAALGEAMLAGGEQELTTFEHAVRDADAHADLLAEDGARVGQVRELQQRIAADDERAARAREELAAIDSDQREQLTRWSTLWAPTAIEAASVQTMRMVLDELTAIRTAADTLALTAGELDARHARIETARADLARALDGVTAGSTDESLDVLLQRARTRRRQLEQQRESAAQARGHVRHAERSVVDARRRLEEAVAALEAAASTWHAALAAVDLPAETTSAAARAHVDALDQLDTAVSSAAAAAARERDAADLVAAFDADTAQLIGSLGAAAGEAASAASRIAVAQLCARVTDAQADAKVHAAATEQLRLLQTQAADAAARRAGATAAIESLQERAAASDLPTLRALDARFVERAGVSRHLAELDQALVTETRMGIDQLTQLLGERDQGALRSLLDAAREDVARLATEHAEARGTRDALAKDLGALERADTHADAAARMRDSRARLEQLVPEYRQLALQERMLQSMLDEHARRDMGPVVERTSRYLETLTCGAWTRMIVGIADDGTPQVQLQRADEDVEPISLDGLSEGTVDQLYLALRLSMLVEGAGRGESMPFVLDDVLPSFDDERAEATFRLLAEVSEHVQVVFLTHHAHLARIAEETIDPARLRLHALPRFGVAPATIDAG